MQPTRDQIRTAICRYLASRAALDDANAAVKTANEQQNAATLALNSATRDLAAITGDAGFVFEGKFIRVSVPLAAGALSGPSVSVCPFGNLDTLDPPAVAVPVAEVPVKATATPVLKMGHIPIMQTREGKK